MRVLIGYDGSECADASIDDLRRAGLPDVVDAQIVSVAEVWLPPPAEKTEQGNIESERVGSILAPMYAKARHAVRAVEELAQRASRRVQTLFPLWRVSATAAYGSPAWEIVFLADRWKPDLVVVGSQGLSALGRFVLGSVSQVVLNEAQCSVRVARGRVEEIGTPVRIVIGVDGSPLSEAAVSEVAQRSWPANSEVKLIVVDDPVREEFGDDSTEDTVSDHMWADRILNKNAAILEGSETLALCTEIIEGNPKHELVRAAEEWGADCIFLGSAGSSNTLDRFVLGSVSAAVASRAHCSVEVVRKK